MRDKIFDRMRNIFLDDAKMKIVFHQSKNNSLIVRYDTMISTY